MENEFLNDKLRRLYSVRFSMKPPEKLVYLGSELAKTLLPVFEFYTKEEFHIAVGYYASDLKPDIGYLNALSSQKTLFFNLYLSEYIADYLIFLKHRDQNSFNYFFAKQMRNLELIRGNQDASALYNRIYLNTKEHLDGTDLEYMGEAIRISLFVAFHELAHQDPDSILSVRTSFYNLSGPIESLDLNPDEIIEIACDFIALAIMDIQKMNEIFGFSKERLIGVSASVMMLIDFYRCFPELTIEAVNNGNLSLSKRLNEVNKTFHNRVTGLLALVSAYYKQGKLFENLDFEEIYKVLGSIGEFFDRIVLFLNEDFKNEIKEFENISSEGKEKYYLQKSNDVWFYYL